jgi:hypothetical protein
MPWNGRAEFVGEGSLVLVGTTAVPTKVRYEFTGDAGAPDAVIQFEVRDGRPECVEVLIKARPKGRGIRQQDVGSIDIGPLAESVYAELGQAQGSPSIFPVSDSERWAIRSDIADAYSRRRRGSNPEELAKVAKIYRDHLADSPVKAVASLMGYTDRTASRRVEEARAAKLLPKTTKGKKKA